MHFHPVLHVEHVSKGPSSHMKPERVFRGVLAPCSQGPNVLASAPCRTSGGRRIENAIEAKAIRTSSTFVRCNMI